MKTVTTQNMLLIINVDCIVVVLLADLGQSVLSVLHPGAIVHPCVQKQEQPALQYTDIHPGALPRQFPRYHTHFCTSVHTRLHLDAFIQSYLQMRTIEAIKTNDMQVL